jgi:hypothetical protein
MVLTYFFNYLLFKDIELDSSSFFMELSKTLSMACLPYTASYLLYFAQMHLLRILVAHYRFNWFHLSSQQSA